MKIISAIKLNSLLALVLILFTNLACVRSNDRVEKDSPVNSNNSSVIAAEPQWQYFSSTNKMTSETNKYATLESMNKLEFEFPYNGGSTGILEIRQKDNNKADVVLKISKGQFLSNFKNEHTVNLRFDEHEALQVGYTELSDTSTDTIFLNNEEKIITELTKASTLKIEVQFFKEGNRILEFNVKNFKW